MEARKLLGVPLITQFGTESDKPAGRDGEAEQLVASLLLVVGVTVIEEPLIPDVPVDPE